MIEVNVFKISGSKASAIFVGSDVSEVLNKYPNMSLDFTVYGFSLDELPLIPPYIKPLIIIQKNSFNYTTKLVDVVYSIFPSPDNSQKVGVYRRPVRNTVPIYFYQTSDGVKASLSELPLPPAMELHRVFMTRKPYSKFSPIDNTCTPVDGVFKDSTSIDSCIESTPVFTAETLDSSDSSDSGDGSCWWGISVIIAMGLLIAAILWKLLTIKR